MTKSLKPVLALSVAALTLLAGCAKGEASTGFSAIKKAMKADEVAVKKITSAEFIHSDAKKSAKKVENEDAAKEIEEAGNSVIYFYTFEDKNGKAYAATGTYKVKDKKAAYVVTGSGDVVIAVEKAGWDKTVGLVDDSYQTYGVLVK